MSLIDVYLYYNRMRGSELITPDDLLQATRHFSGIGSKLELREAENGMKIVQLRVMDEEADFDKYCRAAILAKPNGVAVEDLVRQFGLSLLVARDKLEGYTKRGRLAVDSSVEGVRYYLNDIVSFQFE